VSGAALDAVGAGVHVLATRRPFFVQLSEALGPGFVTLADGVIDMERYLRDRAWLEQLRAGRELRRASVLHSRYSVDAVHAALGGMVTGASGGQQRSMTRDCFSILPGLSAHREAASEKNPFLP